MFIAHDYFVCYTRRRSNSTTWVTFTFVDKLPTRNFLLLNVILEPFNTKKTYNNKSMPPVYTIYDLVEQRNRL